MTNYELSEKRNKDLEKQLSRILEVNRDYANLIKVSDRITGKMRKRLYLAIAALEKIEDPRKIGHVEKDDYTMKCCLMNIAHEALGKIREEE